MEAPSDDQPADDNSDDSESIGGESGVPLEAPEAEYVGDGDINGDGDEDDAEKYEEHWQSSSASSDAFKKR